MIPMRLVAGLLVASFYLSCSASKTQTESSYLQNAFELDLSDKMNPMRLVDGFAKYQLKYECTLDKSKNRCVFSYESKESLEKLISIFSNEVGVESASKTKGCSK